MWNRQQERLKNKEADMFGAGAIAMDPDLKQSNVAVQHADPIGEALDQIRESLRGLTFGSVNIIVQDGVVIQIDRTEKRRLRERRNGTK